MESKPKQINTLKAHLALNVRNVEKSIEFYKKMLGIQPAKVRTGYAKFDVQNPPLNLTLNQNSFDQQGALSHLGIQVASTEDVLEQRKQWADAGLITKDEMQTNCCYAIQDKTWVRDPDGNEWEVFVVLQDNLAATSTCCVTDESDQKQGTTLSCSTSVSEEAAAATPTGCCGPAVTTVTL
jgi:catechol 2,3-dioxygenase-like lactoylglutathione lyase family enzyme